MSEIMATGRSGQMSNGHGVPLTALAIGAAIGASIALLYAPCSGGETRQFLARTSRDLKNRVTGAANETVKAIRRATPSATV